MSQVDLASHEAEQQNPPTEGERTKLAEFVDGLHDWLRSHPGLDDVQNIDGSALGFRLAGVGDVSMSVSPTGHI